MRNAIGKTSGRQAIAKAARRRRLAVLLALAALTAPSVAAAQNFGERAEIWDLELGMDITTVPRLDYQDYACGTNGGPAALPLASFADFAQCRAEANGLHEVQFRYDDEAEYLARAYEAEALIERFQGTRPFGHPAIVSALIDDEGFMRGLRVVTDNRVSDDRRMAAYTFAHAYRVRFGEEGWECVEQPPDERRRPVGDGFADSRCTKRTDELSLVVEAHFYRRPGQFAIDPVSGRLTSGEFESSARLEIYQLPYAPPES